MNALEKLLYWNAFAWKKTGLKLFTNQKPDRTIFSQFSKNNKKAEYFNSFRFNFLQLIENFIDYFKAIYIGDVLGNGQERGKYYSQYMTCTKQKLFILNRFTLFHAFVCCVLFFSSFPSTCISFGMAI